MGKINVLSFAVANLIAAGEVVDRRICYKEADRNAIDAGIDPYHCEITKRRSDAMRVTDNAAE